MAGLHAGDLVAAVMEPIDAVEIPSLLRSSVERQSHSLMRLATSLLQSGMDEQMVRSVIEKAFSSYRDELISTIVELRGSNGA